MPITLNLDQIVALQTELTELLAKYGYAPTERGGVILFPVMDQNGSYTDSFQLQIDPKCP